MAHKGLFFLAPLLTVAIVAGCGGNDGGKVKNKDGENVSVSETVKYIPIADSDTFSSAWSKENTLVYHVLSEPDDMHPANGNSALKSEIFLYTQVFLVSPDFRKLSVRAGSACKALPSVTADGLQYTYELKDYLKWDDGSPMTAEDVIFTFKAYKCPLTNNPHAKPYLENLKDIVVDPANPGKITLVMKRIYVQNVFFLSDYPILQRKYFDPKNVLGNYTIPQMDDPNLKADQKPDLNAWGTEFNSPKYSREAQYLVGLGPYRVEKWDPGQSMTLVRKENHWTKGSTDIYETSYPDRIILKINKDPNSTMLEFKSQALDATTSMDTKILMELQNDGNFNTNYNSRFTDTYNYSYMAMNMQADGVKHEKLFTDKNVRRAMAHLVPCDDINRVVNKGRNKRMVTPVSPLKVEFNTSLQAIPFDVQAAEKLLDAAGWRDTDGDNIRDKMIDGKKVKMEFNLNYMTTTITWKEIAQMTSEAMYKAGVKANINPVDYAVLIDRARNHDFDMMIGAWASSSMPEDFTQLWHSSSWSSKGSNYPGFGNAQSDAIIDSIKYAINDSIRIPLVKKFQEMVYDEQPYIFLFAAQRRNVVHKRFGNCEMYFERPGLLLNNLKLLGTSMKPESNL